MIRMEKDAIYTEAELREMLRKMHAATTAYYVMAVSTGCHTFIEFCGLMGEFVKICEGALEQGIDFSHASVHSGQHLPFKAHHVAYLREKLECIYGPDVLAQLSGHAGQKTG